MIYLVVKIARYLLLIGACLFLFFSAYRIMAKHSRGRSKTHKESRLEKTYREYSTRRAKKGDLRPEDKLRMYGISYRLNGSSFLRLFSSDPDYQITPGNYFVLRIVFGLLVMGLVMLGLDDVPIWGAPIALVGGYIGLDILMRLLDRSDNDAFIPDIYTVYSNLKVQLASGIYLLDALATSIPLLNNKRLQHGLEELIIDLSDTQYSSVEAVNRFEQKFTSRDVKNLCLFFRNYINYGVTEQYINDIMTEINGMAEASALKTEHDVETKTGMFNFAFFAVMILIIGYGMMTGLQETGFF